LIGRNADVRPIAGSLDPFADDPLADRRLTITRSADRTIADVHDRA